MTKERKRKAFGIICLVISVIFVVLSYRIADITDYVRIYQKISSASTLSEVEEVLINNKVPYKIINKDNILIAKKYGFIDISNKDSISIVQKNHKIQCIDELLADNSKKVETEKEIKYFFNRIITVTRKDNYLSLDYGEKYYNLMWLKISHILTYFIIASLMVWLIICLMKRRIRRKRKKD